MENKEIKVEVFIQKMRKKLRKYPFFYKLARCLRVIYRYIIYLPDRLWRSYNLKKELQTMNITADMKIWYLCVPIHNNLGDYAQYVCIKRWIEQNYKNCEMIEIPAIPLHYDFFGNIKLLRKLIGERDLILFQSGYTSSDLHIDEKVHRIIVKNFRDNYIIFFPQTVKYSSTKEKLLTARIYNEHSKLLFLARDEVSFQIAKKAFNKCEVLKFPDIVTSLIGNIKIERQQREGILFCMRSDSEKLYDDRSIKVAFNEYIDNLKTNWLDTTLEKEKICSEEEVFNIIKEMSRYKVVVTDRFHGTIFSLISNTPVIVLNSIDHKVKEGANWFIDMYPSYINIAENLENAVDICNIIINSDYDYMLSDYFVEKYYNKLKVILSKGLSFYADVM